MLGEIKIPHSGIKASEDPGASSVFSGLGGELIKASG